jgi:hypothetical protein
MQRPALDRRVQVLVQSSCQSCSRRKESGGEQERHHGWYHFPQFSPYRFSRHHRVHPDRAMTDKLQKRQETKLPRGRGGGLNSTAGWPRPQRWIAGFIKDRCFPQLFPGTRYVISVSAMSVLMQCQALDRRVQVLVQSSCQSCSRRN